MKRLIVALLSIAALCGCKGVRYDISGTMAQDAAGQIYLVSADAEQATIASTTIDPADGTFRFKGRVEEPMLAILTDDNESPITALFIEEGKVTVSYDENQGSYTASGTVSNDNFNAANDQLMQLQMKYYSQAQSGASEEEQQQLIEEYNAAIQSIVDKNQDNILGAYLFARMESGNLSAAEIRARLDKFPKKLRETKMLKEIEEFAAKSEKTEVGAPYIEIVAKDSEGKDVALSSLIGDGKWVLIDFWATWCGPCREEIPYLKAAYEKYADNGFAIYGVSLDNDADAWKKFISDNGMNWTNVIGIDENKDSASADAYGIRSIPSNFLIGPDGKIAAKNLRGEGVEKKLKEIFE